MHWPQITYIALFAFGWLVVLSKHGEPKTDKHDIGITTAGTAICLWLLWMGGFFG